MEGGNGSAVARCGGERTQRASALKHTNRAYKPTRTCTHSLAHSLLPQRIMNGLKILGTQLVMYGPVDATYNVRTHDFGDTWRWPHLTFAL